jgi:hypothetical protein
MWFKMRFILLLALIACGPEHKAKDAQPNDHILELHDLYKQKKKEAEEKFYDGLWPSLTDCDATLWAGVACVGGIDVQIQKAEYTPGEIHRRPTRACWSQDEGDQGSKSTISNDMLLGYMSCLFVRRDLDALLRLAEYGENRDWVMGEPYPEMAARVLMRSNLRGFLGRAIDRLSGGDIKKPYRQWPALYEEVFPKADYEVHLQIQGLLLHSNINVTDYSLLDLEDHNFKRLKEIAEKYPRDALAQSVYGRYTGDYDKAVLLLLDQSYECPSYVRGDANYCKAYWLEAARVVLDAYSGK